MRLDALLRPELIRCRSAAQDKESALLELVEVIPPAIPGLGAPELLASLAERERLGPFSMGKGVAFPHARSEKVPDLTVAIGTCPDGIPFRAPDGQPIRCLVLFIIPRRHSDLYLNAMAAFLNFFAVPQNLERVATAATPQEVIACFAPKESVRPGPKVAEFAEAVPAVLLPATPLGDAITRILEHRASALPVVNGEGHLTGEVRLLSILQAVVNDYLVRQGTLAAFLQQCGSRPIGELPGIIEDAEARAVSEEDPVSTAAIRLSRMASEHAYVLRGRKLVGVLRLSAILRACGTERPA